MSKKIILIVILIIIIIGIGYLTYKPIPKPAVLTETEKACINSGGQISSSSCCNSANDFPNNCLIGACGCSPTDSHQVEVCDCGEGKCFDGSGCIAVQ
jgi:hypothetical protein